MLFESPESSSPTVTRAVAAGLQEKYHSTYLSSILPWQRPLLRLIGYLPQSAARIMLSRFQARAGIDPKQLETFRLDKIIQTRLDDYRGIPDKFQTITIGAALGGASAHIALAMRSIFLPEAFVLTLHGGSPKGDAHSYFLQTAANASKIAEENPELITIQHFDPIHDGWLTRYVNHLRVKLIALPDSYAQFIKAKLIPGGTICCLQSGARWLRYRVGKRRYFQVGGWGDIQPDEYIEGSQRVRDYCKTQKIKQDAWRLNDYPLDEGPESEWGSEPAFADDLEAFCKQNGYRFIRVALPKPEDYSKLAFRAIARQLELENRQPPGVLIEMFSQFDASAVIKSGLLPLWLIFNTRDSYKFLSDSLSEFPKDKPVFFSPLTTFSITPDIVPFSQWQSLLEGFDWVNIGTRASHYPADTWTLLDWQKPLHQWVNKHGQEIRVVLNPDSVLKIASSLSG